MAEESLKYLVVNCPSNAFARTNCVYVSPNDPILRAAEFVQIARTSNGRTLRYYFKVLPYEVQMDEAQAAGGADSPLIALNGTQRTQLGLEKGDLRLVNVTPFQADAVKASALANVSVATRGRRPIARKVELNAEDITQAVMSELAGQVFVPGQSHAFQIAEATWELRFMSLVTAAGQDAEQGRLTAATSFVYSSEVKNLVITGQHVMNNLFKDNDFDLAKLGIGGLDRQFDVIFRRAFSSRCYSPETIKLYGIKHVKGMLLYGPPGTGKTLIARQIGKMLNAKEPKVVNGPEVLNKYVGQSEENVRALFAEADADEATLGDQSPLHIIIFDEIDAICKARGSTSGGTGVNDSLVNQLLTKIDGVNALNNILLIGMTNRKDMLDEALLRPGRLEAHVEVGLPDEAGRLQILNIHTSKMRESGTLGKDVDVEALAARTPNFSGAEIEGLCRSAASHALVRNLSMADMSKGPSMGKLDELPVVQSHDFAQAFDEVAPQFGTQIENLQAHFKHGMYDYGDRYKAIRQFCEQQVRSLVDSPDFHLRSCLLTGDPGVGKSALAVHLAVAMEVPFVKIISPQLLVGYSEEQKRQKLIALFDDAYKSPVSIVILDDLEGLMDYVDIGPRFSNLVLQTVKALVRKEPPKGHKLLVLATMVSEHLASQMDLTQKFGSSISLHRLDKQEAASVLAAMEVFDPADLEAAAAVLPDKIAVAKLVDLAKRCQTLSGSGRVTLESWMTASIEVE